MLLGFYVWFAVTFYFTRYLAPVAMVVTLVIAVGVGALVRRLRSDRPTHRWRVLATASVVALVAALGAAVAGDAAV